MIKKTRWVWSIIFILSVGGLFYIYVKAEERKELEIVQRDLANHLYDNYRVYTKNKEKEDQLTE